MAQKTTEQESKRHFGYNVTTAESVSRLLTRAQAARYCSVSSATFSRWIAKGMMPAALVNTNRWDRRAIDAALDRLSGIQTVKSDGFDQWLEERNARASKRNS